LIYMWLEEIFDCSALEKRNNIYSGEIVFAKDYLELIQTFDGLCINDFLYVLSPFSNNEFLNSEMCFARMKNSYEAFCVSSNIAPKYHFFDGTNGLFPWGITENGDELYWDLGRKDSIVVFSSRYSEISEFEMCMSEFIRAVFKKENFMSIFPDDLCAEGNYVSQY